MPIFLRTGTSSSSSYGTMSSPSTRTRPRSGRCSPMMCRRSTDLPLPLPPSTTIVSPRRMSKVIPCSTFFGPKLLCTSSNRTNGASIPRRLERQEQLGQEEIADQDAEGRGDHRLGGGPPDAVGPAGGGETLVARDEADEQGEDDRLAEAAEDVLGVDR